LTYDGRQEGIEKIFSTDNSSYYFVGPVGELDDSGSVLLAGNHSEHSDEMLVSLTLDPPFLRKIVEDSMSIVLQLVVRIK
jgi:hypothetical protein